jgi:hypothetical protein
VIQGRRRMGYAAAAGDDEGGQEPNADTPRHGRTTWTGCRRPAP